jgi:hypothetical protein
MISMDKKYKTVSGNSVRVLCVDRLGDYPVVALITPTNDNTEFLHSFFKTGKSSMSMAYDLVEVQPWDDLKKGDYIFVRDHIDNFWVPRIFHKIEDNKLWCYGNGKCEFTKGLTEDRSWQYFRLPTKEELAS